jgi:hypothetical protein
MPRSPAPASCFSGPFLPRAIDRLGINVLVAVLFAGALAAFAAILTVDHLFVWFAARFAMGTCFAALWTTTEIWLNGIVDDRHRGRIVAGSGTLYAVCQFVRTGGARRDGSRRTGSALCRDGSARHRGDARPVHRHWRGTRRGE